MPDHLTAKGLFAEHKETLDLCWITGQSGPQRKVTIREVDQSTHPIVGRFNSVHPSYIQVLGNDELDYLAQLGEQTQEELTCRMFESEPIVVIMADGREPPERILQLAAESGTALFSSHISCRKLANYLRQHYSASLSESVVLHGVFMEVKGIGVLLTGKSGIGKSELALELLTRGHRIIADDAPIFTQIAPDTVNGRCPVMLQDFIEVRGLGILNVRSLFGDSAIKQEKYLRMIINLKEMDELELMQMDRLQGNLTNRVVLDVEIPEVTLPVAPGRNLAVLVESAASVHILRMKGYNPAQEFMKRQRRGIEEDAQ